MAQFEVKQYAVVVERNRGHVYLYADDEYTRDTRRVIVGFDTSGDTTVTDDGTTAQATMDIGTMDRVIDLVRNEKPVFVAWWPTSVYLFARMEPVGEGEPAASSIDPQG